jgi:hypothetical protein
MKKGRSFSFILICCGLFPLTCPARDAHSLDKALACRYAASQPVTSGEAKIGWQNNAINFVRFGNYFPGGDGELSFTCHIELHRQDKALAWREFGTEVNVAIKDNKDFMHINRQKNGFLLSFANLKSLSEYCGGGAKFPAELLIPFTGKSCKVKFADNH